MDGQESPRYLLKDYTPKQWIQHLESELDSHWDGTYCDYPHIDLQSVPCIFTCSCAWLRVHDPDDIEKACPGFFLHHWRQEHHRGLPVSKERQATSYWCEKHERKEPVTWPVEVPKPQFTRDPRSTHICLLMKRDNSFKPIRTLHGDKEGSENFESWEQTFKLALERIAVIESQSHCTTLTERITAKLGGRNLTEVYNEESNDMESEWAPGNSARNRMDVVIHDPRTHKSATSYTDNSLLIKLEREHKSGPSALSYALQRANDSLSSYGTAPSRASTLSSYRSIINSSQSNSFRDGRRVVEVSSKVNSPFANRYALQYSRLVQERDLLETQENELNWSGKGQHVIFTESDLVPLDFVSTLGCSLTASVDMVKCRRIHLARKRMICNAGVKLEAVITEVELLQRLRHSHIIQLVGSYMKGRTFSILLYPATEYNLAQYMEGTLTFEVQRSLIRFFRCLAAALDYIHQANIKHMDIKPKNLLVKTKTSLDRDLCCEFPKIYIGDFGISREFSAQDTSQTDGPTARSPMYCAPEIKNYNVSGDSRGRAADIFSMGCVFVEMMTVILGKSLDAFAEHRLDPHNEDDSFGGNLTNVASWLQSLREERSSVGEDTSLLLDALNGPHPGGIFTTIESMLHEDPYARLRAAEVSDALGINPCCTLGREPYVESSRE